MNVDDIFLMIDAKTSKVDYVSPNVEKLLGITVEEVQKDIRILEKLHLKDSEGEKSNYLENLLADEQREQDFEYIHQKSKERRWFHIIAMGSNVEGKRNVFWLCRTVPLIKNESGAFRGCTCSRNC